MTSSDDSPLDGHRDGDGHRDQAGQDAPAGGEVPEPALDEEAAWRLIVENYGERPAMGETPIVFPEPPARPRPRPAVSPLDRSYLDAVQPDETPAPGRHDDEHFVPPEPPPVPRGTPARRLAWAGLFAPPVLLLLAVVFGWSYPTWASFFLVASFVGGFVFLIATMPRDGGDGWGDGAVV